MWSLNRITPCLTMHNYYGHLVHQSNDNLCVLGCTFLYNIIICRINVFYNLSVEKDNVHDKIILLYRIENSKLTRTKAVYSLVLFLRAFQNIGEAYKLSSGVGNP